MIRKEKALYWSGQISEYRKSGETLKFASLGKKQFYRILTIHYNCMTKKLLSSEHAVHWKGVWNFMQKPELS